MTNIDVDRPGPTRSSLENWNYNTMLGHGTTYGCACQLSDPKTVLPFLYISFGAPALFVGMLLPLVRIARIVMQVIGAPVFGHAAKSKRNQILAFVLMTGALAVIALLAPTLPDILLVSAFLAAAVMIGISQAINTLAWSNMIRRIFSDDRRNALLYAESGLAGIMTIPIAMLLHAGIHFPNALDKHLMLLWTGVAVMVVSAAILFLVREPDDQVHRVAPAPAPAPPAKPQREPLLETLRTRYAETFRTPWFRNFVLMRVLLLSVELAPPFYAIHAATMHKHSGGSLNIFVMATGLAYVVGAPFWRRAGRTSDGKVLVLGALLGAAAGFWAMAIEYIPSIRDPLTYAVVFFLVAFAIIGVSNARTSYLLKTAPLDRQSYFVGLSSTVANTLSIFVALGFGAMAHVHGPFYAICLIIGLNILAATFCVSVWRSEPA